MSMNYEYIRELLDKFYNGETTREEELELTDFFSSAAELPAELEADRKVFAVLAEAQAFAEAPADLDEKIMAAIDASTERHLLASVEEPAPYHHQPLLRLGNLRYSSTLCRIFIGVSAVAAVVALVLLLPFGNETPMGGNPAGQQLASEKILDTLKNMEIIPEIPPVEELAANNIAQANADENVAPEVKTPAQPKIARAKRKSVKKSEPAPEEEYTLSEEEIRALEIASSALGNASQKLAYAYNCIEECQTSILESDRILNRILEQ